MPANYPQLEHPPITEAIFMLGFAEPLELVAFQGCAEQPIFKGWETLEEHEFSVHLPDEAAVRSDGSAPISGTAHKVGLSLKKPDGSRILKVRRDLLSYHILGPYPSGDTLLEEVKLGLDAIIAAAGNIHIARTEARYVNQIRRPVEKAEHIGDIFTVFPPLPAEFTQGLHGFFQQFRFPSKDNALTAQVIQTVIPPSLAEEARTFVLDIDVMSPRACGSDLEQIWNSFQNLRQFKNQIFKAFLTDTIYQSFNPIQPQTP